MPGKTVDEKRQFQRILYNTEAALSQGGASFSCRVLDLSLQGCLLEFEQCPPISSGHLYVLKLKLSDEAAIRMYLRFAHGVGTQVGFKCEHIDIDSLTNLRRLVELNIGDSEMLSRELAALSGL